MANGKSWSLRGWSLANLNSSNALSPRDGGVTVWIKSGADNSSYPLLSSLLLGKKISLFMIYDKFMPEKQCCNH